MKANEAPKSKFVYPDKLYARANNNITLDISYAPQTLDAIEYTRTDAFIEKACAWLKKQGETSPILSNSSNIGKDEQRPTWSEEDEYFLDGAIETEQYMLDVVNEKKKFDVGNISIKEECNRELNWLKSLKDRIQWKPSDEQMNALLWIIENTPKSVDINILLNSLYEQLKAL